jgi:hypothetical protein
MTKINFTGVLMKRLSRVTRSVTEKHMLSNVSPAGMAFTVEEATRESNAAAIDLAALEGMGFAYAVVSQKSLFTVLSNAGKHRPDTINVRIIRILCILSSLFKPRDGITG